jgi:small-conductance mechanosensitive channel
VVSVATPAVTPAEQATPLTTAAALKNVEQKLQEAVARNDNKLAGNKKLEKRMARVQSLLAEASAKATTTDKTTTSSVTTTHKMTLAERIMMKKIDKKIKNTLAPDEAKAMSRTLRAGIVIAIIGFILAILGVPVLSLLGVLLLIAGLVLILVDVLGNA